MSDLPGDVAAELVRLLGHYLRATPPRSLPASVRPYRAFRPQALQKRRGAVLRALDDEAFRAGLLEWLDGGEAPLGPEQREVLRIAAARPEDWAEQLAGLSAPVSEPAPPPPPARAGRADEREKRARAEMRRARDEARRESDALRLEVSSLKERIEALGASLEAERAAAREAARAAAAARRDTDRELRRARKEVASAIAEAAEARKSASGLRRERERLEERVRALQAEADSLRAAPRSSDEDVPRPPQPKRPRKRRRALSVPKGRLPEDPQTLDEWLSRDGVWLLVDGYNVTKSEGGFGDLSLERQRERLVDEVAKLATRKRVPTTIVFDGSEVAPGRVRRRRGPVSVEYSRPGETADDHLVARLREGFEPAILVTNDRDLRARAEALGATLARSDQLLALIR